jgi:hypothetical protein
VTTDRITLPVPAHALPHRSARELLAMARRGLEEAADTRGDGMRFATAHLAALRAAAAVLAERATYTRPGRPRQPVTSVWVLLAQVAPELAEWAAYFAGRTTKRAAAEAGIPRVVTPAEADEMVRAAGQFVDVVEGLIP